ncbi:MAG: D-sedoheptulose-7-phosphate isomerase [Thermodesulfobacteriota bacterium]
MNNVERLFLESLNEEDFIKGYLNYLSLLFSRLDTKAIARFIAELEDAYEKENTIFIVGNGGSASTASHMANDLGMDVLKKGGSNKAFRTLALTDNTSVMTAIANDDGYHNTFVNQLRIHYRPGDRLIVISASGNSPNVVAAARWVRGRGGKVLGLTGFDGGELNNLCDVVIHVNTPKGEYGPVEDIHMVMDHLVANWLQYKHQKENGLLGLIPTPLKAQGST